MKEKIFYDLKPFTRIWVKDCYHMSILPGIFFVKGNIDCLLFNQYFKYSIENDVITYKSINIKNVYELLKDNGIDIQPILEVKNIHNFIKNELNNGNVIIMGIDSYFETLRNDYYQKRHSGHSVLICGINEEEKIYKIIEQPFFFSLNYQIYDISFNEIKKGYESFLNEKQTSNFFYNILPDILRVNGEIPSVCLINIKGRENLKEDISIRNRYIKNLQNNIGEIIQALESILEFRNKFKEIYISCIEKYKENEIIILKLNELINNKLMEQYLFELLFRGEDNKYEIFNLIIKKWSKIRMIFSKRIYSNRYIESQIVKGMSLLTEIYDLEKNMVYRRINNGKV